MPIVDCPHFIQYVAGVTSINEVLVNKRIRPRGIDNAKGECNLPRVAETGLSDSEIESYITYLEFATAILGKGSHPQHRQVPTCIGSTSADRLTCDHWLPIAPKE